MSYEKHAVVGYSDSCGRYYTRPAIGEVMVRQMNLDEPRCVVDLGVGAGALSYAALKAFADTSLITVDIDPLSRSRLKAVLGMVGNERHCHIKMDALSTKLPTRLKKTRSIVDAAVCNPPFVPARWRKAYGEMLEEVGFSSCLPVLAETSSAMLFLAQNLRVISNVGTVGIILPDSLISSSKFQRFRESLLRTYSVESITRLPRGAFQHTEALAHLVVVRKGVGGTTSVRLQELDRSGRVVQRRTVDATQASVRLDAQFHQTSKSTCADVSRQQTVTLGELSTFCKRGNFSSTVVKAHPNHVLHTSDLLPKKLGQWLRFPIPRRIPANLKSGCLAFAGDILVSRVGRDLERRIAGVYSGRLFVSDCVFVLRVPKVCRREVLRQLASSNGQQWLASRVYGVGARQLTMSDLLAFPVTLDGPLNLPVDEKVVVNG